MTLLHSHEAVGQSDVHELTAAYEASSDLPEHFRSQLSDLFETTPDRLDVAVEAGRTREGDGATAGAVIEAIIRNPDRRIRFLEIAGGPTYIQSAVAADFGSPWVARRIGASLPVDAIAVDRLPSAPLEPTNAWAGFACFYKTPRGDVLPFQYLSYNTDESDVLVSVVGQPPLSAIDDGRFIPVGSSYITELEHATRELGLKPMSPLAYFRNQLGGEIDLTAGSFFIRPIVDAEIEERFFHLAAHGGVNARDVSQLPDHMDIVSLRHTGTYFTAQHVEAMHSLLEPDGQLLISGDPPGGMSRVGT